MVCNLVTARMRSCSMPEEPKSPETEKGGEKETVSNTSPETVPESVERTAEAGERKDESSFHEVLSKVAAAAKGGSVSGDDDTHQADARALSQMDAEGQIQKLLDMAESKGVAYAVGVARKLGDYYVLDKMRDELADRLYAELVSKGLIEKV